MGLIAFAMLLFLAMVVAWAMLPGSSSDGATAEYIEPAPTSVAGQTA